MRLNPHQVRLNIKMNIPAGGGGAWARWGAGSGGIQGTRVGGKGHVGCWGPE